MERGRPFFLSLHEPPPLTLDRSSLTFVSYERVGNVVWVNGWDTTRTVPAPLTCHGRRKKSDRESEWHLMVH